MGIVKMILLKSNGEIASSIDWSRGTDFGGDCRGGCMHK